MIKYNNSNINDWYFDASDIIKVYRNNAVCYYKITTSGGTSGQTPCYAVVEDISQYQDTEFEDVFNKADGKWYKLNNLNNYEEYGVYGSGRTITYYEGKLTVDDGYEYQYSGNSWVNVGEVSGSSRVPAGYTEVEYLESPTTSEYPYINTNFAPNQNTRVIADLQYTHTNTHPRAFGCGAWNSTGYIFNAENGIPGEWRWKYGVNGNTWLTTGIASDFDRHKVEINNGSLYLDDVVVGSTTVTTFQLSDNIALFGFMQNGTLGGTGAGEYMTGKFYSFKIYDNGTLARDFVPCKNSSNIYGMYDIVGNSFYTSPNSYLFSGGSPTSGGTEYPIYYDVIQDPPSSVTFSSMTEAEEYECPYVGLNADIDGTDYIFDENYDWVTKYGLFEITGEYICADGNKYKKMEEKVRNVDDTWSSQTPPVYEIGDLIESASTDCQIEFKTIQELLESGDYQKSTITSREFTLSPRLSGITYFRLYTQSSGSSGSYCFCDLYSDTNTGTSKFAIKTDYSGTLYKSVGGYGSIKAAADDENCSWAYWVDEYTMEVDVLDAVGTTLYLKQWQDEFQTSFIGFKE